MTDDPRLAEAARLFNAREFFACHDVLEDVWNETIGPERDLLQGLIHAAVALFHFSEGNYGGARKMYHSAVRYLNEYLPRESPFDVRQLLADLHGAFEPLLAAREYPSGLTLKEEDIPRLRTLAATEVPA
jgi:uncharacterized protein